MFSYLWSTPKDTEYTAYHSQRLLQTDEQSHSPLVCNCHIPYIAMECEFPKEDNARFPKRTIAVRRTFALPIKAFHRFLLHDHESYRENNSIFLHQQSGVCRLGSKPDGHDGHKPYKWERNPGDVWKSSGSVYHIHSCMLSYAARRYPSCRSPPADGWLLEAVHNGDNCGHRTHSRLPSYLHR